jgi:hypothetical protein
VPDSVEVVVGDFIANAPLYQRRDLKSYAEDGKPPSLHLYRISPILRYCSQEKCKSERPFRLIVYQFGFRNAPPNNVRFDGNIHTLVYECTHCESPFWCSIEVPEDEWWIRKVGQLPPYDISIASDLQNVLGDDARLYKRAQICMSQPSASRRART